MVITCGLLIKTRSRCFVELQERIVAQTENRPMPFLYNSTDIRPLTMNDFKLAHELVCGI